MAAKGNRVFSVVREEVEDLSEDFGSSSTRKRAAAAKKYIENHYKNHMNYLQQRKERRQLLEKMLADSAVSEEEHTNRLKELEQRETEYMRLKRLTMSADDFELSTSVGRGAFGELQNEHSVRILSHTSHNFFEIHQITPGRKIMWALFLALIFSFWQHEKA